MPPGALDHVVPVGYLLAAAIAGGMALLGGAWGWLKWLKAQIREEFKHATDSEQFEKRVGRIVKDALKAEVQADMDAVRERQKAQAVSIQEAHRRIDKMYDLMAVLSPEPNITPIPRRRDE